LAPFGQAVSEEKIFFNISQSETRIALENLITYLGVIALFSSNFQNFNTFRFLFKKL
jgi:hypothetical protein